MANVLLILGGLFMIIVLGLHTVIVSGDRIRWPKYTTRPILMILPWVCGLVLPILCWAKLTKLNWALLLILNFVVVFFLSHVFAYVFSSFFVKMKKYGPKILIATILGVLCIITGYLLK